MGTNKTIKIRLQMVVIIFLISIAVIIATTPLHEAGHWVMSDIDPSIEPTEFHIFDGKSLESEQHVLSSSLGCVIVKESYPGAFQDRPAWADAFQEIICIFIQIILTCIIVLKILRLLIVKHPALLHVQSI
jgi:hypothetical protein